MVAAITQLSWYGGSATEPAPISAEDAAGITFNREDSKSGNPVLAGISIAGVPGTAYSWPKVVGLLVTAAGTTTISNRRISPTAALQTGVHWYVRGLSAYVQPASVGADAATDNTPPSGYTEATQIASVTYDAAAISSAATGRNGGFASMVLGVDSQYAASGGLAGTITLPTYRLTYDEA